MFGKRKDQVYPATGTTSPIFIPRESDYRAIRPGEDYFFVKIHSAQAAFTGRIWEHVKQLIVISRVSLNHPLLGAEPLQAIQRSREVKREQAEQLGLSPNLVNLVPATMTHVSISIEFVLDKQNRLATLGSLINDDAFVAAASLAPGAVVAARVIGGISQKIIQTFFEPEERQPIVQFSGDFNIPANALLDGYYIILGTRDANNPLPDHELSLDVENRELMVDGQRVTQLSYVILDVRRLEARTRDLNDGAVWAERLREAEGVAQRTNSNPFADREERSRAWDECTALLKEAQQFLNADPNYLAREADQIIRQGFVSCRENVFEDGGRIEKASIGQKWAFDFQGTQDLLGIEPDEDLDATLNQYARQVEQAGAVLRQEGMV